MAPILSLHPTDLTEAELLRSLFAAGPEADACERSVRGLAGSGLLRRDGASILPTLAAIESEEIL